MKKGDINNILGQPICTTIKASDMRCLRVQLGLQFIDQEANKCLLKSVIYHKFMLARRMSRRGFGIVDVLRLGILVWITSKRIFLDEINLIKLSHVFNKVFCWIITADFPNKALLITVRQSFSLETGSV